MNEELAQELHKPVIKKIQKEESLCNICAIDLVKMGSSSLKGKTYKNWLLMITNLILFFYK